LDTLEPEVKRKLRGLAERRLAANRTNAAKSTGPRTKEGKAVVAGNAVKHGLLCDQARIGKFADETPEAFEAFRDAMISRLEPEGQVETVLAERAVSAAWRLRRSDRFEGLLITDEMHDIEHGVDFEQLMHGRSIERDPMARAISKLFGRGMYEQLSRYETRIQRGMYKAMHELQRLQGRRRGEPVPPPIAVDLNGEW